MDEHNKTSVVDDVWRLHELFTPDDLIARRLHLPPDVVRYIIRHGKLPPVQLLLRWRTEETA